MIKSAVISEDGKFRYRLGREWDATLPSLAFIALNPSTADAQFDDATVRKCIGFGERLGFGSISIVNLFAFRATKPADLRAAGYQDGPDNVEHIRAVVSQSEHIVCAWGANARGLAQPHKMIGLLRHWERQPKALRFLRDGIPEHPLMLPYSCTLQDFPIDRAPV